jgi:hypothetical protein
MFRLGRWIIRYTQSWKYFTKCSRSVISDQAQQSPLSVLRFSISLHGVKRFVHGKNKIGEYVYIPRKRAAHILHSTSSDTRCKIHFVLWIHIQFLNENW